MENTKRVSLKKMDYHVSIQNFRKGKKTVVFWLVNTSSSNITYNITYNLQWSTEENSYIYRKEYLQERDS